MSSSSLLGSMSGGTDIVSCFALSNPTLPVYSGEIQCRGLGMAVDTVNEKGESLVNRKGELVCRKPFPSMPIGFWGEDGQKRYHDAYFETMKGVWFHGDYSLLTERGGVIIFGRSDTTLNPGGVRIGSAELYRVLDHITAILDSIVVSAERGQGEQIVLFVKLQPSLCLDDGLIRSIQKRIRNDCSPRHVPKEIFQVNDIPYTLSGKKVEKAVKDILEGRAVLNRSVLRNPESLDEFKR